MGKGKKSLDKMVEAQARGKTAKGAKTEKKKSRSGELDERASKAFYIKFGG